MLLGQNIDPCALTWWSRYAPQVPPSAFLPPSPARLPSWVHEPQGPAYQRGCNRAALLLGWVGPEVPEHHKWHSTCRGPWVQEQARVQGALEPWKEKDPYVIKQQTICSLVILI